MLGKLMYNLAQIFWSRGVVIRIVGFGEWQQFVGASTFGGRLTELISPVFVIVGKVDLEREE